MPVNISHPAFLQPDDSSISIWRYMDFAKYVAMLKERAVYFARLDTFDDPFEGSLSKAEYVYLQAVAREGEAKGDLPDSWKGRYFDVLMEAQRRAPRENYISCWHMNNSESEAMWKLYASSGYAVAIKSTYERLAVSLPNAYELAEHTGPFLGIVKYVDYQIDNLPRGNSLHRLMHKRLSFAHEQECRAVVWRVGPGGRTSFPVPDHIVGKYPAGINLETPLEDLVECVVVSPNSPAWFTNTVADLTSRYGYNFAVQKSALSAIPYL